VKVYVAAVQALRKKETQDETQFTTKIGGKPSLGPNYAFDALLCRNWHILQLDFQTQKKNASEQD
jgi:hypothetical protein